MNGLETRALHSYRGHPLFDPAYHHFPTTSEFQRAKDVLLPKDGIGKLKSFRHLVFVHFTEPHTLHPSTEEQPYLWDQQTDLPVSFDITQMPLSYREIGLDVRKRMEIAHRHSVPVFWPLIAYDPKKKRAILVDFQMQDPDRMAAPVFAQHPSLPRDISYLW